MEDLTFTWHSNNFFYQLVAHFQSLLLSNPGHVYPHAWDICKSYIHECAQISTIGIPNLHMQTELSLVLHLLPFLHLFDQIDQVICLFDCYTKQISEIHRCILSQVYARKSIFRKIQFYTLHSLKWRVWANYSIARSRVLRFRLIKGHFKEIRPLIFLGQRFSFGCQMFSKIQYKRVILFL